MKFLMTVACVTMQFGAMYAQQQSSHTELDSVVVKENRLQSIFRDQNKTIEIMDKKQIAALPVKSTAELLSYMAGVDLRQRGPWGTQADVSIDGSTFDEVLVLVNGMKMSDPQTGHHILNLPIPLAAIDHIEVLRGAAAKVYGVNALAGAINIVTRTPVRDELNASVYASGNFEKDTSNGESFYGWGASASAAIARKKQSHMLSLSHDQGNGYRYNTASNVYRVFYQNEININAKNALEASGGYTSNEFGAGLFYAAPYDNEAKEAVQTATGSIKHILKLNDRISISPRLSYRYNKDEYMYIRQKPEVYHNIHETNVVTGEIQSSIRVNDKALIGAGVELRNEQIHSTNLGRHERNNLGAYAEGKYQFNGKLNAGIGVYANYNSDYDWQLFPGIDLGYRIAQHWKVYANASTGQRLPTYTDLYYNGPSNTGNASLKPETASFGELGLQFDGETVFLQGNYFLRHTDDFIDWVKDNLADKWKPQNFQSVNTQGISLQANYNIGKTLHLPANYAASIRLGYTYLDASIETPSEKLSKYAIDALRHQLIVSLQTVFFRHLQLDLNGRYQQRISLNDYTLLDGRIAYLFPHWNIRIDVNNILDTQYKELGAVPLPGRWYTLGAGFNIAGK